MVPKGGIEPPTRGSSNRRSTSELLRQRWGWLQRPDSNRRPKPYEDPALTTELHCTSWQCARTAALQQVKSGIRAVVKSSWRVMVAGRVAEVGVRCNAASEEGFITYAAEIVASHLLARRDSATSTPHPPRERSVGHADPKRYRIYGREEGYQLQCESSAIPQNRRLS